MWGQRLAHTAAELAERLATGVDVLDFLQRLAERCAEVLEVEAAVVMVADQRGALEPLAVSDGAWGTDCSSSRPRACAWRAGAVPRRRRTR